MFAIYTVQHHSPLHVKLLYTVHAPLCFWDVYGYQNKGVLFPHTTLTNGLSNEHALCFW